MKFIIPLIIIFTIIYIIFIRERISGFLPYFGVIEWGIFVFIILWLFMRLRGIFERSHSSEPSPWSLHISEFERRLDREFMELREAGRLFIEEGVRGPLIVFLSTFLHSEGWSREDIMKALYPIIEFRGGGRKRRERAFGELMGYIIGRDERGLRKDNR